MLPKDNFYNLILEYRLPVSRKDKTVSQFLEMYFSGYIAAYKKALIREATEKVKKYLRKVLKQKGLFFFLSNKYSIRK